MTATQHFVFALVDDFTHIAFARLFTAGPMRRLTVRLRAVRMTLW
jgi:hypothetical protein